MLYFIVSGYIPGTDIQLSFNGVIFLAATTFITFGLYILIRNTIRDTRELIALTASTTESLEEVAI